MKTITRLMNLFLLSALLATGAMAQSIASAQLSGTVKDPKGAVVPNAAITVRDDARNFERSTRTSEDGEYQILQLPPGQYTVTVSAAGFAKYTAKAVTLTVGQAAELPVALGISATETVDVNAQTQIIETQITSSNNTIQQQRIDNLPINGRNYVNFSLTDSRTTRDVAPSIGAAPTSGINFSGQRARSNLVNLDGMDNVDNSVNGIRSTVSQEAVQEFQIVDNSYAAEYGRASGGVVNIVTRSGNNDFHGTAFAYLRNRNIQATNPFSNVSSPAYTRVQPGFTLGGPIVKNRTFWFLSYEGTFREETGFSTISANNFGLVSTDISAFLGAPAGTFNALLTPQQASLLPALPPALAGPYALTLGTVSSLALTGQQPAYGSVLLGLPPGTTPTNIFVTGQPLPASFVPLNSLIGNYPVKEHTNVYSLRLDDHLTNNQQLFFRFNVSPSFVSGIQVNAQNQNFGQNAFSRTSVQNYHDVAGTLQHTWTIGNNRVNELRFQYARRGLRYDFSRGPGGGNVAINIPGFAFFGREPFSFVDRTEQRFQAADNFSWTHGSHTMKFGADTNHIPINADFSVNFGGLFNFGALSASSINAAFGGLPDLSPIQAYGFGVPQVFVQGIGNPHLSFSNNTLGVFAQDSWRIRPNLTLNYGVRYDVEFTPTLPAVNSLSAAAQNALGIVKGIPQDTNNVAPRVGIAWDPWSDGKTVVRASYGIFYDHPLLALAFDSIITDGSQAPQVVLLGGNPCTPLSAFGPGNLNATNVFQGSLNNPNCFGLPGLGYLPNEQRFNAGLPGSLWVQQNYLAAGIPLLIQPFGFPVARNFVYAYSEQANLSIEHDLGHNFSFNIGYNFNGGHHLNRPINVNAPRGDLIVANWERAVAAAFAAGLTPASPNFPSNPGFVGLENPNFPQYAPCGVGPAGAYVPAALVSFFRPSGLNPSLAAAFAPCVPLANALAPGFGVPVPFSDMIANFSNGSSVYHGLTANLKKRFSNHYEFLASYTWSHTLDDSTDLQSLLEPQSNFRPDLERSNSTFDQRHRLVLSGVYQSGKVGGDSFWNHFWSNWTVAPIIEIASGRPFTILVGSDANLDQASNTDRPSAVTAAQAAAPVPPGCLPAVASKFSPTGFLQPTCFVDADMQAVFAGLAPLSAIDGLSSNPLIGGNLRRNSATRPYTVFTDFRVGKAFKLAERINLEGTVDMFNLINRFNVADVNPLYTNAGTPTAAYDPRQFQFGLKLSW